MSSNLPVIISDRNELDALCRAWLGFDSATVERLQSEAEAGHALYAALKQHHKNDVFDFEFAENIDNMLMAYERERADE